MQRWVSTVNVAAFVFACLDDNCTYMYACVGDLSRCMHAWSSCCIASQTALVLRLYLTRSQAGFADRHVHTHAGKGSRRHDPGACSCSPQLELPYIMLCVCHCHPFLCRVWTCFEYCMMKSADLLRDRHLDQIIMCCIYVLSKVCVCVCVCACVRACVRACMRVCVHVHVRACVQTGY